MGFYNFPWCAYLMFFWRLSIILFHIFSHSGCIKIFRQIVILNAVIQSVCFVIIERKTVIPTEWLCKYWSDYLIQKESTIIFAKDHDLDHSDPPGAHYPLDSPQLWSGIALTILSLSSTSFRIINATILHDRANPPRQQHFIAAFIHIIPHHQPDKIVSSVASTQFCILITTFHNFIFTPIRELLETTFIAQQTKSEVLERIPALSGHTGAKFELKLTFNDIGETTDGIPFQVKVSRFPDEMEWTLASLLKICTGTSGLLPQCLSTHIETEEVIAKA